MTNPKGYAIWSGGDGKIVESDTVTCAHCQVVTFVSLAGPESTGWCLKCSKHICGPCADKGTCRPFEKWLESEEKKITDAIHRQASVKGYVG